MNYFRQLAVSLAYLLTWGLVFLAGATVLSGATSMGDAVFRSTCFALGFGLATWLWYKTYRVTFPLEGPTPGVYPRARYFGIGGGVAMGLLVILGAVFSYVSPVHAMLGMACSGAFGVSACLLFRSSYSSLSQVMAGVMLMAFAIGMAMNSEVFYAAR